MTDTEAKEDFLLKLEPDRLCELAVTSTENLVDEGIVREALRTLFYSTLPYQPCRRGQMCDSAKALHDIFSKK
jgi:hypothetical protein